VNGKLDSPVRMSRNMEQKSGYKPLSRSIPIELLLLTDVRRM
jgi:hypothetical protein